MMVAVGWGGCWPGVRPRLMLTGKGEEEEVYRGGLASILWFRIRLNMSELHMFIM